MNFYWEKNFKRVVLLMCLIPTASSPSPGHAFGALAIGETGDIKKDGVAVGICWNQLTKNEAEAEALRRCKTFPGVTRSVAARCKIIKSFEKQCASTAIDPEAGTPGFGSAVMTEKADAESAAMNHCRETAGKVRAKFCTVDNSHCDTQNGPD